MIEKPLQSPPGGLHMPSKQQSLSKCANKKWIPVSTSSSWYSSGILENTGAESVCVSGISLPE